MTFLRSKSSSCWKLLRERPNDVDSFRAVAFGALERARMDRNHAWVSLVSEDDLLEQFARIVAAKEGGAVQPLFGVPFAVKDNIDVKGLPTTAACPSFSYDPDADAPVVAALRAAGALVIGKTNMDQFATGLVGTRSPLGAPHSVVSPRHISGGSSSGSAVVVADGTVGFSLGTDTAGSGRVPAAFNEIIGLKPTKGLLSTRGLVPACRSLDCVSIFAPTVEISDLVLKICAKFDSEDPFARDVPLHPAKEEGLVLGSPPHDQLEFFGDAEAAKIFVRAKKRLETLVSHVTFIDGTPFRDAAQLLYGGPWVAERYAAVGAFLENPSTDHDPTVRSIILSGNKPLAVDAFRGQYELKRLARLAEAAWKGMDVLVLPTTPTAYTHDEVAQDPVGTNTRLGTYTNFVNLLDLCAIAVPAGVRQDGAALGITLLAPAFHEQTLTRLADRYCATLTHG